MRHGQIGVTGFARLNSWGSGPMEGVCAPERLAEIAMAADLPLVEGYAPFCQWIYLPNCFGEAVRLGYAEITEANERLLRSAYRVREGQEAAGELPVLERWFDAAEVEAPAASYLGVCLYTREALAAEGALEGLGADDEWGIVTVLRLAEPKETPPPPQVILRNTGLLGGGGSGVEFDEAAYRASVEFWGRHAVIK